MMNIIPIRPILRDFGKNISLLREVLFYLFVILTLNGVILYISEELIFGSQGRGLLYWIGAAFDDVMPPETIPKTTISMVGTVLRKLNALIGYIILGLMIWVVEHSVGNQPLRKSRFLFFAARDDA